MKTALVTGCTPGGIGHALALELKKRGLRVFATGRTVDKISELKKSGIECVALSVDDPKSVAACHEEVKKLLDGNGLDYLYNNAGIAMFRPAAEINLDQCKTLFGANVFGVMDMCQTFFPELLAAKGTIVNVGSIGGHVGLPFMSTYAASKAALYEYSECIRAEFGPLGIKVVYIMAGNVKSNVIRSIDHMKESSPWYPVRDMYEKQQHDASQGMDADKFVKLLANQTLVNPKDTVWVGEGSLMCWIISVLEGYLPFRLWPFMLSQMYNMKRVAIHRQ